MKHLLYFGLVLLATVSCNRESTEKDVAPAEPQTSTPPSPLKAAPAAAVSSQDDVLRNLPQTYADLVATSNTKDRQILDSFYSSFGNIPDVAGRYAYSHIFDYKDRDQLAWLLANGFPSPKEVLAASRLSDIELAEKVEQGDWRTASALLTRAGSEELDPTVSANLADQAMRSGTAYGGYVFALQGLKSNRPENAVAGIAWAFHRGDMRAYDFIPQEARTADPTSVATALMMYVSSQSKPNGGTPFPM